MLRIETGTVDQEVYFDGENSGLSGFTVTRARNGAAAATMTTPTVTEVGALLPNIYSLLLDEDMILGAGNVTEHMVFYITAAGMPPKLVEIELFSSASADVTAIKAKTDLLAFTSGNVDSNIVKVAGGADIGGVGTGGQLYGE